MSFGLQFKLLLWKNYVLKKRTWFVLILEILIPLVLFFILLFLRWRQPATKMPAIHFTAWPLPSAGVVSVMEAFCDGGVVNEHGFVVYPNSSTYQFLSNLNRAAKRDKFFEPDFAPSDLGEMRDAIKNLVDDAAGWMNSTNSTGYDAKKMQRFVRNLEKFNVFRSTLREFKAVADFFPQDECGVNSTNRTVDNSSGDSYNSSARHFANRGLLKLWNAMQLVVCGSYKSVDEASLHEGSSKNTLNDDLNLDGLGLSSNQRRNLKLLIRLFSSNPRILYAPSGTMADEIMKKANWTFSFVGNVTAFARAIMNASQSIEAYLESNSTQENLNELRLIHRELQSKRDTVRQLQIPALNEFLDDDPLPDSREMNAELVSTKDAACSWIQLVSPVNLDLFVGFRNEKELVRYFLEDAYRQNVTVFGSIIFKMNPDGSLPDHMVYKIRQNASYTTTTLAVRSLVWSPGPRDWDYSYYSFGFMWMQDIIERAMIELYAERDVIYPGGFVQEFPYPCYMWNNFLFMIKHILPMMLAISWVYWVSMLVQAIVYEKEQRLKEVMKTMGMTNSVHWLAWFTTSFAQITTTMILLTMVLKFGDVLTYSNPFVVFLILEVFGAATILFSFLISTFYSNAKIAAAWAGIIYFLSYVPFLYISIREEAGHVTIPGWAKAVASLSSTSAFGLGAKYFAHYETEGTGCNWKNLPYSPLEGDTFTLLHVILMMMADVLLYGLMAFYMENVFPGQYGVPKPWYFLFTRSYWNLKRSSNDRSSTYCCFPCARCLKRKQPRQTAVRTGTVPLGEIGQEGRGSTIRSLDEDFELPICEPEPTTLPLGVKIERLCKQYNAGDKHFAVDHLSMNLYEGQITAFLGHNGAGKTTTMSMLTGLLPATSGTAQIYGRDIINEMDTIRKSMGTCPQYNVLFDKLTVDEHLWFYARLKGVSDAEVKKEAERLTWDLGLPDKRHSLVDTLSGGMKRKLSVAIAFVGGSKTVILDEPTAGVDPYARRAIWDLIIRYKPGRTILLSSHHMDEADVVGDRIAIVAQGKLRCFGSPLFLKSTFGEGYHLKFVKQNLEGANSPDNAFDSLADPVTIKSHLRKFGPPPILIDDTIHESHFTLRRWTGEQMQNLMRSLEDAKALRSLHVISYGLYDSTLEEVFLKVSCKCQAPSEMKKRSKKRRCGKRKAKKDQQEDGVVDSAMLDDDSGFISYATQQERLEHVPSPSRSGRKLRLRRKSGSSSSSDEGSRKLLPKVPSIRHPIYAPVVGTRLYFYQFCSIICKRCWYIRRNWRALFSQIFLPILFVIVAMSVAFTVAMIEELPPMELSPAQYYNYTYSRNGNVIPFTNVAPTTACAPNVCDSVCPKNLVATLLYLPSGVGATCLLYNSSTTFDPAVLNSTMPRNYTFLKKFFIPECEGVFVSSEIATRNFVPPSDDEEGYNDNATTTRAGKAAQDRYYPECYCSSDGAGFRCASYGYTEPPATRLLTNDVLYDLTGQNESEYYLYTTDRFRLRRYGALSFGHVQPQVPPDFGEGTSSSIFKKIAVQNVSKAWFDNTGYHAMPIYLNTLNNAILRAALLPTKNASASAYGITLINHPMEGTNTRLSREKILEGTDVLIAMFIVTAMSFVPASFVLFLVNERRSKAKHLQFLAGMNPVVYWTANFVYDFASYLIPAACCCAVVRAFAISAYVADWNFVAVVALFIMYGFAITPMMYPATFYFEEPSTAYISMIVVNLFLGITCIITSFMLQLFGIVAQYFNDIHEVVKVVFLVFPTFCLGRGLMDVAFNYYFNEFFILTGQYNQIRSPFYWDIINRNLVSMAVIGVLSFVLTLYLEYRRLKKKRCVCDDLSDISSTPSFEEETDVARERRRVTGGLAKTDIVRVVNLNKTYKSRERGDFVAVDQLCFGVPKGECFGLLGVNGAGKTTTFGMLTGDLSITSGEAFLGGYSIRGRVREAQSNLGYCPQFDCLFDELTAREHLAIFCLVRGVPRNIMSKVIDWALEKLDLSHYANEQSFTYSGGTKRKLSTAIALIGDPSVVMLDEPTTGMDPLSRRFLWDVLIALTKADKSVVLTSHSMEECEALCTRLAIMVNGRFQCIGSIQHLKNTYGDGYSIRMRVKTGSESTTESRVQDVTRFMVKNLADATLKESHHNYIHYEINSTIPLSRVFGVCEKLVQALPVESYSVGQNDLDNVFVNFAKHQGEMSNRIKRQSRRTAAYENGSFPLDDASIQISTASVAGPRRLLPNVKNQSSSSVTMESSLGN